MVLSFILIQNRQGKTRLAKWYNPYTDDEKIRLKGEVHRLVAPRDQKHQSNFVEFRGSSKVVYRRYAGLFFCACVDANDNELAYLEAIHFFVEVLDQFFGNVCELDLVFNFYKVYAILDEVFLAGEIQETSKQVVLTRLEHLDKLDSNKTDRSQPSFSSIWKDSRPEVDEEGSDEDRHLLTGKLMKVIEGDAEAERMWKMCPSTFPRGPEGNSEEVKLFNRQRRGV
ncbi:AP-2 complex subunit sigma [Saxophila tyrrhenica]|uniref:AP-2 complex subunit sigma n=1 Tax=Saxophila tyrrhenica TaxID=1690608 RepID=A0AAV9P7Q9_9PEZI|nr:AP-2 complex subunit sigma [Saxophila tyrrhenica]